MFGITNYKNELKVWNKWVRGKLTRSFIKKYPNFILNKTPTQKELATFLVDQSWIENVQKFVYKSAKSSGLKMSFKDFKVALTRQEVNGKVMNVWSNNYERNIVRPMLRSIKSRTTKLTNRYNTVTRFTVDKFRTSPTTLKHLFSTIDIPDIKNKKAYAEYVAQRNRVNRLLAGVKTMDDYEINKLLSSVKEYIHSDILNNKQPKAIADALDKSLGCRGKRLAQDQLQRANNEVLKKDIAKKQKHLKDDEVLVVYSSLSPSHTYHGDDDPCPIHAKHDEGYGRGGYRADRAPLLPYHIGCKCNQTLKIFKIVK